MGVWQDELYVSDNQYNSQPISFGLQIFDVSDPGDLRQTGTVATGGPVEDFARAGERIVTGSSKVISPIAAR